MPFTPGFSGPNGAENRRRDGTFSIPNSQYINPSPTDPQLPYYTLPSSHRAGALDGCQLPGGLASISRPGLLESIISGATPNSTLNGYSLDCAPNALPVAKYRKEILGAVRDNRVVIVTAETGAGKSTLVPQFLLDDGYSVMVTQPRRLAATALAERVAHLRNQEVGQEIGFRHSQKSIVGPATRLTFCTDGYEFAASLAGASRGHDVLIVDEAHEWNLGIEGQIAYALKLQEWGHNFKLVIMSATIDAERLAQFVGGAPVINIPGRLYPVTELPAGYSMIDDSATLLSAGHNVLAFLHGKREIYEFLTRVEDTGVQAVFLPLHGELSSAEQQAVFEDYDRPMLVAATNIAQTSITIPRITAVIDSGLARVPTLRRNAVECLDIAPISFYDSEQRKGRAGRVRPGIYVWHGPMPRARLQKFPTPEIRSSHIDQMVLRFAAAGFKRVEELRFFHEPPELSLVHANKVLRNLGLLSSTGNPTKLGERVAKLPVSSRLGVMIDRARHWEAGRTLESHGLLDYVIGLAAIIESKSIVEPGSRAWHHLTHRERRSDVLAQLRVFAAALTLSEEQRVENQISEVAFLRALDIRSTLHERLGRPMPEYLNPKITKDQAQLILDCIWSGMLDRLFVRVQDGWTDGYGVRNLPKNTVIPPEARFVVSIPLDLAVMTETGDKIDHRILTNASQINLDWFQSHAPHLVQKEMAHLIASASRRRKGGSKNFINRPGRQH